ncbi:hypothetical protein [uncultured Cyclobacterium sp.]|uniref:hypothetical protein n=1 Tax=uncultured Cyclobacterium sp. TaxID=453820 RepID=UPI0030EF881D|tara:strand:+ start:53965 stop:55347 length:1383 start_codon:yes stop_codon:yes gene_type:complete
MTGYGFDSHSQSEYIGNNRELFVDDFLIDRLDGATLEMHAPKDEGIAFTLDNPWEGKFSLYSTIIKDDSIYRVYYRGLPDVKEGNDRELTCYAESKDGINWYKPSLGIHEINGSKDNNVILIDKDLTHNFSPFLDTNPNAKEKYKALAGKKATGLYALTSEDGIHWVKAKNQPVLNEGNLDSQNVSFWSASENKYLVYFRTSDSGFRSVSRASSLDFTNWDEGVEMKYGAAPLEHLYTQQTSPYFRAPQIYLAIGGRFMPNKQVVTDEQAAQMGIDPNYYKACSDAFLMSSRGGAVYNRYFMESFIRPAMGLSNWVSRTNYPALNVVQTSEYEMSIYVNQDYAQSTAHMRRYSMRLDGFSSLTAGYGGGEMITKPFVFDGKALELNFSTSAAGEVFVELLDEKGNKIPGFSKEECQTIIGNELARNVYWNKNTDVSKLSGKAVRMKIYLKDANIYSFRFH